MAFRKFGTWLGLARDRGGHQPNESELCERAPDQPPLGQAQNVSVKKPSSVSPALFNVAARVLGLGKQGEPTESTAETKATTMDTSDMVGQAAVAGLEWQGAAAGDDITLADLFSGVTGRVLDARQGGYSHHPPTIY